MAALKVVVVAALFFCLPLIFEIQSTGLRYLAVVAFISAFCLVAIWILLPPALKKADGVKMKVQRR